jgi:hypothetical protein
MEQQQGNDRRTFIRKFGLGLLGTLAGIGFSGRKAQARVFAELFLKDSRPVHLPFGYYDEQTQIFRNVATHQPMFAAFSGARVHDLTDKELDSLFDRGGGIDVRRFPRLQVAECGCTVSRQQSYSTTGCCPIQTDTKTDIGCDDTCPEVPGD